MSDTLALIIEWKLSLGWLHRQNRWVVTGDFEVEPHCWQVVQAESRDLTEAVEKCIELLEELKPKEIENCNTIRTS